MKNKKHQLIFAVSIALALASWAIAICYYAKLPSRIPTHFGFNGQVDGWSNKSIFTAFFIPFLQTLFVAGFAFLYKHPQYSDMPTTLWLQTLDKETREHSFGLIRTMLVVTLLWLGVMFTYITYAMNISAYNSKLGLSPWIMVFLIVGLLVWLVYWTIKVYKETRSAIEKRSK